MLREIFPGDLQINTLGPGGAYIFIIIDLLPEASFGLRVLSSPLSVCLSVCVCVYQSLACPHDNSSAVQARITKFET